MNHQLGPDLEAAGASLKAHVPATGRHALHLHRGACQRRCAIPIVLSVKCTNRVLEDMGSHNVPLTRKAGNLTGAGKSAQWQLHGPNAVLVVHDDEQGHGHDVQVGALLVL